MYVCILYSIESGLLSAAVERIGLLSLIFQSKWMGEMIQKNSSTYWYYVGLINDQFEGQLGHFVMIKSLLSIELFRFKDGIQRPCTSESCMRTYILSNDDSTL